MKTIQATVSPRLLKKATRLFTGTREGRVIELLQNARRAGATRVEITNLDGVATVRDNGSGIQDFATLINLGASGWQPSLDASEDPAGVGVFCLAPRTVAIRSNGQRMALTEDSWTGTPVEIEDDELIAGTEIQFQDEPWEAVLIEPLAVFTGMEVIVDGRACERHDFVSDAAVHHPELGCRIEVIREQQRSRWHRDTQRGSWIHFNVLVNFHGQVVGMTHHPVGEPGLYYLVDLTGEPTEIRLLLPARTQLVENEGLGKLKDALELEAFRYLKQQGAHRLPYKDYLRAHSLGIALPEATPTFKVGLIGGSDMPDPVEVSMPDGFPLERCYRVSETLAEGDDFAETNTHLLAALGTFATPFAPVSIKPCFDGYSWAQLPTVHRIELTIGKELHADYVASGRLVCVNHLALTAHTSDGKVFHAPICMAIRAHAAQDKQYWTDEDVLVTPEANQQLLASQIWYHLGGWSEDGDTYDTQEDQVEQELNRFWADLIGPDEQLRRKLLETLLSLKEKWRSITIRHNGTVTIQRTSGKVRTIKPRSLPK